MDSQIKERVVFPLLSIIIPTYNRPESLTRCLSSITKLDGDDVDLEIIVVDDGSTPSCQGVVEEASEKWNCLYLQQENQGPAAARNRGASKARGRFLVFLDDDCTLPSDWLEHVKKNLDSRKMTGGTTVNMAGGIFSEASQVLVDYLYQGFRHHGGQEFFLTSNNMIVPSHLFRVTGGFSESFPAAAAEDRDFCDRWRHDGYEIVIVPEIVVEHYHDMDFPGFVRQHFNYGFGAFIYHGKKKDRAGKGLKLESLRFYIDLLRFPFKSRQDFSIRNFNISACLFLSQLGNLAGFMWAYITSSVGLS